MPDITTNGAALNSNETPQPALDGIPSVQVPGPAQLVADQARCTHLHSITGDFGLILRLLPEYTGGHPQPGYMLDICKVCLRELPERPYSLSWPLRHH